MLNDKNAINEFSKVIDYMKSSGVNFYDEDIEFENKDFNIENDKNILPFDSTKINIVSKTLSIEGSEQSKPIMNLFFDNTDSVRA